MSDYPQAFTDEVVPELRPQHLDGAGIWHVGLRAAAFRGIPAVRDGQGASQVGQSWVQINN